MAPMPRNPHARIEIDASLDRVEPTPTASGGADWDAAERRLAL